MTKSQIGFIGIGLMGAAMVGRLLEKGYPVAILGNRTRERIEKAVAKGAIEASSAKDIAQRSEIVMLCMDTSTSVEARMFGEDGVIAGLKPGSIVVDFGTSLPDSTKRIAAAVEAAGARYMDAPLGRTPSHAVEGKLNIMAAGSAEDFARLKPIFEDLGENVFHVGPLGAGHTLKLINNFFAMTTACAMSEAFAMADKAGIERDTLYGVMSAGPLKSGMMDFIKAYAVEGNAQNLAFSIANGGKDVGYYTRMADDLGVPSIMSIGAKQALSIAKAEGHGDKLVPEMVDFFAGLFARGHT